MKNLPPPPPRELRSFLRHALTGVGTAAIVVGLSSLLFVACKKDVAPPGSANVVNALKSGNCTDKVQLACHGAVLSFANMSEFNIVYACLETELAAHNAVAVLQYGYLNEEDYNDMLDNIGWVDHQPLLDFEAQMSFTSYRSVYDAAEQDWLANNMDPALDPENWSCESDPIMQTLLGTTGAMIIGGVLQFMDANCDWWTIPSGDCSLIGNTTDPGVEETPKSHPTGDCFFYYRNTGSVLYDNNKKRERWTHEFKENLTWGYAHHKTTQKYYRKFLLLFWKTYRVDQGITIEQDVRDENCVFQYPYSDHKADRIWCLKNTKQLFWPWFFANCELNARFTGPGGTIDDPTGC